MPTLEADDVHAWNFYMRNARTFVRDFSLMPHLIARMQFDGIALDIFMQKLCEIHDAIAEKVARETAPSASGSEFTLKATDNV